MATKKSQLSQAGPEFTLDVWDDETGSPRRIFAKFTTDDFRQTHFTSI